MSLEPRKRYQEIDKIETKLDDLNKEYHQKQDEIFNAYKQGNRYLDKQHDIVYNMLTSLDMPDEIKAKAGYVFEAFGDEIMRQRKQAEAKLEDEFQSQQKEFNKQLDELDSKSNYKQKGK